METYNGNLSIHETVNGNLSIYETVNGNLNIYETVKDVESWKEYWLKMMKKDSAIRANILKKSCIQRSNRKRREGNTASRSFIITYAVADTLRLKH